MSPPATLPEVHHYDWPPPGQKVAKMTEIDLPYQSSGTEWWYYNFHLVLDDGSKASAFIAFFRTSALKPVAQVDGANSSMSTERCDSHLVHFAISILPPEGGEGSYLYTSAMDNNNASYLLSMVGADHRLDPLLRRSLTELLEAGKVPEPDVLLPDGSVRICPEGSTLNLQYGDIASVVYQMNDDGDDVYHITARSVDRSFGFNLDLIPRKAPINHGANGVVVGDLVTPEDAMYYCFVPRCEVSGTVLVGDRTKTVISEASSGWYDREFGGSIRKWSQPPPTTTESSWHWGSAQMSNGCDLTWYTLWDVDVHSGEKQVRDKRALVIDSEGRRIEYDTHSFLPVETWVSMATLNEYGTKWKLEIPQANVELTIEAPFVNQELRSICATRGYWEGRVSISGVMEEEEVTGLGFVEVSIIFFLVFLLQS
jgi:predicted secreted hydrolase